MFAPRYAPKLNREVRRSPTWHSSKSESALKRFEPVAMDKLLLNGRGTLFALVAARRQGEIYKRWNASYMTFGILRLGDAVQRWLRHPEPSSWSHKSTIREKYLYVSCGRTMFAPPAQKTKYN